MVQGHLQRLRSGVAAERSRTRRSRGPADRIRGSRRGTPPVCRWGLRYRAFDFWRHVYTRPGSRGRRTSTGLQVRGPDRLGELDAGGIYRSGVQDAGKISAASAWGEISRIVGYALKIV